MKEFDLKLDRECEVRKQALDFILNGIDEYELVTVGDVKGLINNYKDAIDQNIASRSDGIKQYKGTSDE